MRFRKQWLFPWVLLFGIFFMNSIGYAASFLDNLSLGLERNIGYSNYQAILAQKRVVQLPTAETSRLNRIFSRLVAVCGRAQELNFNLTVLQDESVNAFSLPGGYVFVNTGLLHYVKNDGELAGVLGHEIAHIARRHGMRAVYRAAGISVALELLLSRERNEERQDQVRHLAAISMNLAQLGFSREAEFEADDYGVRYMQQIGYPKSELLDFWRRLETKEDSKAPAFMAMFATHPPTRDRIQRIEAMHDKGRI